MLTSQIGIVTPNGGVHMATAFLRLKVTVAATVWTRLYRCFDYNLCGRCSCRFRSAWIHRNICTEARAKNDTDIKPAKSKPEFQVFVNTIFVRVFSVVYRSFVRYFIGPFLIRPFVPSDFCLVFLSLILRLFSSLHLSLFYSFLPCIFRSSVVPSLPPSLLPCLISPSLTPRLFRLSVPPGDVSCSRWRTAAGRRRAPLRRTCCRRSRTSARTTWRHPAAHLSNTRCSRCSTRHVGDPQDDPRTIANVIYTERKSTDTSSLAS